MIKKSVNVALVGAPNSGKSSLLNQILGKKNSIVSPKPHTTRGLVLGAKNVGDTQIVFLDTPGYIRTGASVWSESFTSTLTDALDGADVIVLLVDSVKYKAGSTNALLKRLCENNNVIICINKIDLVKRADLYEVISYLTEFGYQDKVFITSAYNGAGVQDLVNELISKASESEWLFENESDAELERHVKVAECVREKLFYCVHEELPFSLWTRATKWYFREKPIKLSLKDTFAKASWRANVEIVVAQESQRRIVIGAGAGLIKRVGIAARTELETIWGPGQLFLDAVVDEDWQTNSQRIEEICYMSTLRKVG